MSVTYCIPSSQRTPHLLRSLPSILAAATASPPVDVLVVDYANREPLAPVLEPFRAQAGDGVRLRLLTYPGAGYFHMAHARNLGIRATETTHHVVANTDTRMLPSYFQMLRERLAETGAAWLQPARRLTGIICVRLNTLLAVGGFDERFEFYGSEDADIRNRLVRLGVPCGTYPDGYLEQSYTPNGLKVQNYREPLSKAEMHRRGFLVYDQNNRDRVVEANAGLDWGSVKGPCQTSLS